MDCSKAKYYSSDRHSYPCPQGHLPCALTNWAIYSNSLKLTSLTGPLKVDPMLGRFREVLLHMQMTPCCIEYYPCNTHNSQRGKEWHNSTVIFTVSQHVCLLSSYVLVTSKVISGWVPTCDSVHSWWLCSAAPLGNQAISTMTRYPTQLHYPILISPCPILIMLSTWLGSDK